MSENVISIGCMAIFKSPIGDYKTEEWQELVETLYENSTLSLNYEGTLIYSDNHVDQYDFEFKLINEDFKLNFIEECKENSIDIDVDSVKIYIAQWYNGADSYMSECLLKDFNKD